MAFSHHTAYFDHPGSMMTNSGAATTAVQSSCTGDAAARVFHIPELLEHILSQLPRSGAIFETVTDLFVVQRVSHAFRDTVLGSQALLDMMLVPPAVSREEMEVYATGGIRDGQPLVFRLINYIELVGGRFDRAFCGQVYQHQERDPERSWRRIKVIPEGINHIRLQATLARRGAHWSPGSSRPGITGHIRWTRVSLEQGYFYATCDSNWGMVADWYMSFEGTQSLCRRQ